jgi:hypothetical protein
MAESERKTREKAMGRERERGQKTQKPFVPVGEKKGNNRL